MKRALFLSAAVLATVAASPARAALVTATFSGTVATQTNSGLAVGAAVSGNFTLDTTANKYTVFRIDGQTFAPAAAGVVVTDSVTPDQLTALFSVQNSQVQGAPSNTIFTLDLEGTAPFGSTDPLFVASHLGSLALDLLPADAPFNSTFGYSIFNAAGTLTSSLTANITSIANLAIGVPEPASMALMLTSLLGLGFARRR